MARKPAKGEKPPKRPEGKAPQVFHVHAVSPERDAFEIRFPRVEGYTSRISTEIRVAWERVPALKLDPAEVPNETLVKALTTDQGRELSLHGPGASEHLTLDAWRATRRLQELEFSLARALTRRYTSDASCSVPPQVLFPQLLRAVQRFLRERVQPLGRRNRKDVFLEPYFTRALDALAGAIVPGEGDSQELPRLEA